MKLINTLLTSSLVSISLSLAQQLRLESVASPQLDLSSFNNQEIGFLGDFDSISHYKYKGASNFTNQNNLTDYIYYTTGNNDNFIAIGQVSGQVSRIIPVTPDTFLLLGDFTSIGDYNNSSAPATFNITANRFTAIDSDDQIDGTVVAGLYDESENIIYLGGDFTFNDTTGVAYYNLTSDTLHSTLFDGFGDDSKVNSIVKVGGNIIFGGQFDTLGLPQLLSTTYNNSNISVTTDQLVSLKYASFSSSEGSSSADILGCPDGEEWATSGTTTASFAISLPYTVYPSKVRIYNSNDEDSQVNLFRLITIPAAGIMNLTYVDPDTGALAYCDAWCPLLDSSSLSDAADSTGLTVLPFYDTSLGWSSTYQEFGFVNQLDVSAVQFTALDSYGSNIALAGFEIYQSMFSTYANNSLNEISCSSANNYSMSDLTGSWSTSSNGNYLASTVDISNGIPELGVTFYPNITYAGQYSILMYTPGCSSDDTCDYRGIVNVTLFDTVTGENLVSSLIYQTNEEEKYDTIYSGHLDNAARVEMVLYSTVLSGDSNQIVVVADRISTTINSIDQLVSTNGTVGINGIFEYSVSNFTKFNAANLTESTLIGNTTINLVGTSLSEDADVQLVYEDGNIYIGGVFESDDYGDNFFVISVDASSDNSSIDANVYSANGGLNGNVSSIHSVGNGVIVIGEFDSTNNDTDITALSGDSDEFSGVALYNGTWFSFGEEQFDSVSNLTLKGSEFWSFGNQSWSVENSTWFIPFPLLDFNISSAGKSGDSTLFVGSLRTADQIGNKGVMLSNSTFEGNVTNDALANSSFNVGIFINDSLSAFGGEFVTESGITNLILESGNDTTGVDIDWDSNTTVTELFAYQSKLFIGTSGGGSVDGDDFNGIVVYNLDNGTFQSIGSLSGSSVSVNQFGYYNSTYLVVGGEFDSADSRDCSGLCFYNMNETSWSQLIDDFSGTVNSFRFINNTIVAGGDFTVESDNLKLFAYDFNSSTHVTPDHFSDLDSDVSKLLLVDNSTTGRIIVSGTDFISAFDGSSWTDITAGLEGSVIADIELFDLGSSNSRNNGSYFEASQVLLASGNLTVNGYGYANVAFFNSTSWLPYAITTHQRSTATVNSIFMNRDQSSLYISGTTTNSTRPSTTTSSLPSSSTTSANLEKPKSGKMDRGFIVLVGLACALGTVGLLGLLGAFFLFRSKNHEYIPLEPRVNETEMLDTVPPESLLKHV